MKQMLESVRKKLNLKPKEFQKVLIVGAIGFGIIIIGVLAWQFVFSKYLIFNQREQEFLDAVKQYYESNPSYYPKQGETNEVTLQRLYDNQQISALYVPKSKKLCSADSWVRIYHNEKDEYEYYVYLECGNFKSKVDHEGPKIELNGEEKIIVDYGKEYQDPGVKSVVDKVDGEIDIKHVTIDTSKVNVHKVGTYTVTYKVKDKLYNETVVERTVVVAKNLTDLVKSETDDSNIYKGKNPNNILEYSGMLWHIIRVNEDGSVKLAAYDNVATINYGNSKNRFDTSNAQRWLNEYFYSYLNKAKTYLKTDSKWCIDDVASIEAATLNCTTYSKENPVGLLTLGEYLSTKDQTGSYLETINPYWLINKDSSENVWGHDMLGLGGVENLSDTNLNGIRPVINLKAGLYVANGEGSYSNPYRIGDHQKGKENELLNTRLVGEHVMYSGYEWRISDIDKEGNTKLVMLGPLMNIKQGHALYDGYSNTSSIMKFNVTEEGNLGYKLNNDYIDFINDELIVKHEFKVPTYKKGAYYNELKTDTFQAKLSLISSYEMFSGNTELKEYIGANYWLIDYVPEGTVAYMINSQNGTTFFASQTLYDKNGMRLVVYLDKDTRLAKGSGTHFDPYYVK
ncbi:MAG: DUF5011 domain-containing protein [bacterium]|nr:DUF5011 domain-containing protein [bacterium]